MFKEKHFTGLIYIIPMVFIILTASIITFIHIEKANSKFETDYNKLKEDFLDKEELRVLTIVESVNSYIKFKKASSLNVIKDNIKSKIEFASRVLNKQDEQNKDLHSSIQIELLKSLSQVKSSDNGEYFIYTYKDNTKFLDLNYDRSLGEPIYTNKDYLKKFNKLIQKKSEGFILYSNNESNSNEEDFKVSYIKDFPKLNIVVGYSVDLKEYISISKNEVKKRLDLMSISDNGYIFTMDDDLRILQHSKKYTYVNRSFLLYEQDKEVIESISGFLKKSKVGLSNEKYKFIWKKIDENSYKLYILNYIKHWNWLISVAVYIDDIDKNIEKIIGVDKQKTEQSIKETIQIVSVFLIIALIISYFVSLKLTQLFERHKLRIENQKNALKNINATLEFKVEEKTKELEELNEKLKNRFKEEVRKNRKKDQLLYSQSKMASMGEMIGNIAHQWRQPLSTISTIASGNSLKMEFDILEKDELKKDFSKIVDTTIHLSDTIEDFRNFFNEKKILEEFDLTDLLEKNLSLISASMKNSYITIIENYNSVKVKAIKNELLQATLNILNNARDALLDIDESKRFIVIDIYSDDDYAHINIKDSAGGIPDNIKEDIFKAHFTTKGENGGTGIGLYMTKQIVEKHANGILSVENEEFVLEDQVYKGSNFKISLPLSK